MGDTVLCNGILKRLGAFADKFSIAANCVVPIVASLEKDRVLLAASVAPSLGAVRPWRVLPGWKSATKAAKLSNLV